LLKLDIKQNPDTTYQPGDHIAIYPVNDATTVDNILANVKSPPDADSALRLEIQPRGAEVDDPWAHDPRFREAVSLRTALTYYLDISSAPTVPFLAQLTRFCTKSKQVAWLKSLTRVILYQLFA
jgi:sulfite reductase alpha subunit-like flavoprotein